MDYLGGGDVEALHTPNRGVEAGLLSLRQHGLLRWLLKSPEISCKFPDYDVSEKRWLTFKHSVVSRKSGFRLAEICSLRLPKLEIELSGLFSGLIPLSEISPELLSGMEILLICPPCSCSLKLLGTLVWSLGRSQALGKAPVSVSSQ